MPHCLLGNSCGVVITPHTKLKLRSEANRRLHSIAIMISIVGSTKSLVGSRDEALCATVWLQNRPRGSWSPWKPPMFNLSCHSALWQPVSPTNNCCCPTLKSTSVSTCFRGFSRLPSAFVFFLWFKLAHISIQVCTFHDRCKQGIDQQIFNRKLISRKLSILSPENCKQSWQMKSWKAEVTAEKKQTQDYNQNRVFEY